ncbi:2'-5' RNA ligase family protein [Pseudoxanthomonas sp.]|uniref:2'-5' RNA ligase family protein n=1 Tax=Pseudoxanthomonas sp. TaxID=1871049 RepID=UPI00260634F8|nr:2'-5' RNA ligase family protein [Pseudoxanthomonas sp.]WDS36566.1 MAG: 2'-5' RNA ligase family protein [Pseudoxanthomonas sp.]
MQDDFFARPSTPPPSLFFALMPSEGDQAVLDEATRLHATRFGRMKPVLAAKRHVTLLYLGQPMDEQIPSLVAGAGRAMSAVQGDAFVLTLDQVAVFGRNSVVLVASQTPRALAGLEVHMRQAAMLNRLLLAKSPAFHPHLTLGHNDDRRAPPEDCAPVRLAFDSVVLLRGVSGAPYDELGRWSLA